MPSIRLSDPWDGDALGYDAWKTREPDWYYEDDPEPECSHEERDYDPVTMRAECQTCGEHWDADLAEMRAYEKQQRDYARAMWWAAQRGRWLWWWDDLRAHLRRWRARHRPDVDDEIPF